MLLLPLQAVVVVIATGAAAAEVALLELRWPLHPSLTVVSATPALSVVGMQ